MIGMNIPVFQRNLSYKKLIAIVMAAGIISIAEWCLFQEQLVVYINSYIFACVLLIIAVKKSPNVNKHNFFVFFGKNCSLTAFIIHYVFIIILRGMKTPRIIKYAVVLVLSTFVSLIFYHIKKLNANEQRNI